MEIIKRFLEWITLKEKLHFSEHKPPLFNEGEIWWCSIGENIGIEMNGKGNDFSRPILVFKKISTESFLGLPARTQNKKGTWYVSIRHRDRSINIILSQARIFDAKRLSNLVGRVDDSDFNYIKTGFRRLFLP